MRCKAAAIRIGTALSHSRQSPADSNGRRRRLDSSTMPSADGICIDPFGPHGAWSEDGPKRAPCERRMWSGRSPSKGMRTFPVALLVVVKNVPASMSSETRKGIDWDWFSAEELMAVSRTDGFSTMATQKSASKWMMPGEFQSRPDIGGAPVCAVPTQTGDNGETTGASITGVKVRITRQRTVGRIARHSDTDIAAGVTTGRPWPSVVGAATGHRLTAMPPAANSVGQAFKRPLQFETLQMADACGWAKVVVQLQRFKRYVRVANRCVDLSITVGRQFNTRIQNRYQDERHHCIPVRKSFGVVPAFRRKNFTKLVASEKPS